jgi:hypothetical protein
MKHFDPEYQYINDSPIDLSGIEGADKPTDLSGIHDGATCECEMCLWANKQEREMLHEQAVLNDIDQVLMSLSPFAVAWASAPDWRRKYVEEDLARYWFRQGQIATNSTTIEDLNAMESMMKARGLK